MAHNVESMMYAGDAPWHRLGKYVGQGEITSAEAIQAAGLNWEVELKEIYSNLNNNFHMIPDKFSVTRKDNNVSLGVVGKSYMPLQNMEAFSFLDSIIGKDNPAIYHTAGSLGKGEKIWALVKFPQELRILKDDVVEKYFLVANSHNGSTPVQVMFTPIRVVCQNTLHQAIMQAQKANTNAEDRQYVSVRHTKMVNDGLEKAKRILFKAETFWSEFQENAELFTKKKMDKKATEKYLKAILNISEKAEYDISSRKTNEIEEIHRLIETGRGSDLDGVKGTLWGHYNAVVEFIDHEKKVRKELEDGSKRLDSMWFGKGRDIKERAYVEAVRMVRKAA